MPTTVLVFMTLAGVAIVADFGLTVVAASTLPPGSPWDASISRFAPMVIWLAGLVFVFRGAGWARYVLAALLCFEVITMVGVLVYPDDYIDYRQIMVLTPLRLTAIAFLFTPSARRWFGQADPEEVAHVGVTPIEPHGATPVTSSLAMRETNDATDGPAFWGLLWVLPLFAVEWWFIPEVPSEAGRACLWTLAGVLTYVAYVRLHERRSPYELAGGRSALAQGGLGILVGLAIPASVVTFYLLMRLTWLTGLTDWHTFSLTLGAVALWAAIAVFEEFVFRGVVLRYLELGLGSWPALVLSALLFAAYHSLVQYQSGPLFADRLLIGLMLGAGYLMTRRLWLSIGMHGALNVGISLAFGTSTTITLLHLVPQGDPFLTSGGGAWVPPLAAYGFFALVLVLAAWRSGKMVGIGKAWILQKGGSCAAADEAAAQAGPR